MSDTFALPAGAAVDVPDAYGAYAVGPAMGMVVRPGLCSAARPCLGQRRVMARFCFPEATLIVVLNGTLTLDVDADPRHFTAASGVCLVAADTVSDICKSPAADGSAFRSLLLTFPAALLGRFLERFGAAVAGAQARRLHSLPLVSALQQGIDGLTAGLAADALSDGRLELRVLDLLLLLAEQGYFFAASPPVSTLARLRQRVQDAPQQHWTAKIAGQALGMSEATLRRRLAEEGVRFEGVLRETRLMHGLLLLQTTRWSISRVAECCGYQSHARFSTRFKQRFNVSPSGFR